MARQPTRTPLTAAAVEFEAQRRRLHRLAYRMLGSAADAADAVQDAFLRWAAVDHAQVRSSAAFLTTVVVRLCLDRLRANATARAGYPGVWLPEPSDGLPATAVDTDRAGAAALSSPPPSAEITVDVPYALMVAMDRLSPRERAAYVLHELYQLDYAELADILDSDADAVRQLLSRARAHIGDPSRDGRVSRRDRRAWVERFIAAASTGDLATVVTMLRHDVVTSADGGGKRAAAMRPIVGRDRTLAYFAGLAQKRDAAGQQLHLLELRDDIGVYTRDPDGGLTVLLFELAAGVAAHIYVVRNPDKLAHIQAS